MEFDAESSTFKQTPQEAQATGLPHLFSIVDAKEYGLELQERASTYAVDAKKLESSPIFSERAHARELLGRSQFMFSICNQIFKELEELELQDSVASGLDDFYKFLADQ